MKRRFLSAAAVAILGLAFTSIATAQQVGDKQTSIIAEQKAIRAEVIAKSNGWDAISEADRTKVIKSQDRIFELLEGKQSGAELSQQEQVEVVNALEWINAIAKNAEDERLVCKRERATGSNKLTRVCKTVAQMRNERETAVKTMTNPMNQNNQLSPEIRN